MGRILINGAVFVAVTACQSMAFANDLLQVGDLSHVRVEAEASTLNDGRVLVTSGWTASGVGCSGSSAPIADADIYDPQAQSFQLAAPMVNPRWQHEQIKMDDGRVLIMGGATNCVTNMTSSAEIFDPVTNSFSATGSMTIPRRVFPTYKMPDGSVLAFGGIKEGGFGTTTDRVDRYDPSSGTWSTVGYISQPRGKMGSCDLGGGKVLLFGGKNRWNDNDPIRTRGAEIYDTSTHTTRTLVNQTVYSRGKEGKSVTLADGRCLIAGGGPLAVELFNPTTETFSAVTIPAGADASVSYTAEIQLLNDGKAFISWRTPLVFDPTTDSMTLVAAPPNYPHSLNISAKLLNGTVLIAGGRIDNGISVEAPSKFTFLYATNDAPTANAGPDQSIRAGDLVTLDGTGSFDDNTATVDLGYAWSLTLVPPGSAASLVDANTATPSFTADIAGTYLVELIVTDGDGESSDPSYVEVSSDNLAPTAVIDAPVLVVVGDTVGLDATNSSDPEMDVLTFGWSIDAAPVGSTANLASSVTALTSFVPDIAGNYDISLSVADVVGPGTPDGVTVNAADPDDYVQIVVGDTADIVDDLPSDAFHGGNGNGNGNGNGGGGGVQNAFLNFLQDANQAVQDGDIALAISILQNAISRTDGCANNGVPDGNGPGRDWITDCPAQDIAYPALSDAVSVLQGI